MIEGKKIALVNMWEPCKYFDIYRRYFEPHNQVKCVVPKTSEYLYELANWADIVWSIFANESLILLSRSPIDVALFGTVRLYEIFPDNGYLRKVAWENVDGLLFESTHIERITNQMYDLSGVNQRMAWDCVWLDEYPLYDNGLGFDIAYIGHINHKKGWQLLLQCMAAAVQLDSRYKLHVAGDFQELRWEAYIRRFIHTMGLQDNIIFYDWVDGIQDFLKDKNYLLSTSQWEGCPKGIIEAMACGIKPLIHNWVEAEEVFPKSFLFNTVDEFKALLESPFYLPKEHRFYVEDKFNAEKQMPLMEEFIESCLKSRQEQFASQVMS